MGPRRPRMAVVVGALVLAACGRPEPSVVVHTAKGAVRFGVEVAATDATRERGLMYRNALARDRGMIFLFEQDEEHAFWMKNTLIPLDMIFIGADDRVVGIRANATPLSTTPISVGRPSRRVLEIAGGEAARQGIAPGDRVELVDGSG